MGDSGYGLRSLVVLSTAVILIFAASFFHPRTRRDWRAFGLFSGFMVALFAEMYGLPVTVYLLSGWLGSDVPGLDLTHDGGHFWTQLIGWDGDPHLSPFHLASYVVIGGGFVLMAAPWPVLLVMFPVLLAVYRRRAIAEEAEVRGRFGDAYDAYAAVTARFVPRWNRGTRHSAPGLPSS